jgi:hypothetical protein
LQAGPRKRHEEIRLKRGIMMFPDEYGNNTTDPLLKPKFYHSQMHRGHRKGDIDNSRNGSLVTCLVNFQYTGQGSLDTGNIADLILLDGNPLENIRNIRKVNTVIKGGQVYDTAILDKMAGFQ